MKGALYVKTVVRNCDVGSLVLGPLGLSVVSQTILQTHNYTQQLQVIYSDNACFKKTVPVGLKSTKCVHSVRDCTLKVEN